MKNDSKKGISYPHNKEYDFISRLPVGFCGCFICGCEYKLHRDYWLEVIRNQTERKLLFNEMWEHKPYKKTKKITSIRNINYNIPHGNMKNVNIPHLRINHDLNYYQPQNKDNNREINQYGNRQTNNTPEQKHKKEG